MANKVLVLGFKTTPSEGNVSFTVNRPAATLTGSQIKVAMENMIAQNVLSGKVTGADGEKVYEYAGSIAYAKYVTTDDTTYDFE